MIASSENRSTLLASPSRWNRAFHQRVQAFPLTPLPIVAGQLPETLRGSLYRNGPALFERGGERIAHWFDGDGAVLGVHFEGGTAQAVYRTVQTAGYQAEEAIGRFRFGGYGRRASVPFWQSAAQATKNVANTSVLALPDRVLALWEGGHPHALDSQTLETVGVDTLGGLAPGQTFSAHPKIDPKTGAIYNFGITFGRQPHLHLYACDRHGQIQRRSQIPLKGIPLIHDFVLAGAYLVFFISPVYLNPLPLLLNWQSYSDALRWQPEQGTQILVVDRETLALVSQGEADPWFQWHFGNGFVDREGQIQVDVVRYADFQTNQFLKEVPSGQPTTAAPSQLVRLVVDPATATLSHADCLSDRSCEFPTVAPADVGQPSRYTYCSARSEHSSETDLFDAIARYDHQQNTLTMAVMGASQYPSEPLFAPDPDHPDRGWLLTVVYDGDRHASEVWIYDGDALAQGPICRLALPSAIAFGFHGTWMSR